MAETPLAKYAFLPWLRQGLAAAITDVDNLGPGPNGPRAAIKINVKVRNTAPDPAVDDVATKDVQLIGPGDIIGIEQRVIVRTDPRAWVNDFEPNYLAAIEFYDEDFPWRYTPAAPNSEQRLRPWLCLIVLTPDEFDRGKTLSGPLPSITLKVNPASVLPAANQSWAWAHGHVNRDVKKNTDAESIADLSQALEKNTDVAISRVIAPRRLAPNQAYHAFLIPTFEAGRLIGLDKPVPPDLPRTQPAWGGADQVVFPVYYEWPFHTGEKGDFEFLVRLLEPRTMADPIGRRPMDVQRVSPHLPVLTDPKTLKLEGALKIPNLQPVDPVMPASFTAELVKLINAAADAQEKEDDDPLIVPPLYGRWHALTPRVAQADTPPWVDELNTNLINRAPAGFGTLVVQTNQEQYMHAAWQQVGKLYDVNRYLRHIQFGREVMLALYDKHLITAKPDRLLALAAPLHARVLLANVSASSVSSAVTLKQNLIDSALPVATTSRAFRRITRPRGAVMRRFNPSGPRRFGNLLDRINRGEITATPPKTSPEKQIQFDRVADQLMPPEAAGCLKPFWGAVRFIVMAIILLLSILALVFKSLNNIIARLQDFVQRGDAADSMHETNLTPDAVQRNPARPGFAVTHPGDPVPAVGAGGTDSPEAANFRKALIDADTRLGARVPITPVKPRFDLARARTALLDTLHPNKAMTARAVGVIRWPKEIYLNRPDPLEPIMAAPDFPDPMFKPLRDISPELMIPNLNLIPPNTISLLQTNQRFIESYMVGLNQEMAHELLWREYPTDQRGSYFRQFWDVAEDYDPDSNLSDKDRAENQRDIKPIHTWPRPSHLSDHNARQFNGQKEHLVLLVRGDLLRKYPTTVIYAAQAHWLTTPIVNEDDGAQQFREPASDEHWKDKTLIKRPVFRADIGPDLTFFGFELDADTARGDPDKTKNKPGWFFCIKERPGDPRFGLDEPKGPIQVAKSWDDLSWGHLTQPGLSFVIDLSRAITIGAMTSAEDKAVHWNSHSADMAYILLQDPVKVYVHASEMLKPE
jgi:hypothetical protein